jgi:peptidyl-prolyl cis-trans isomerase C
MLLAGMAAGGCGKKAPPTAEPAPLARVGDVAITEEDFAFEVRRRQETGRPLGDSQTILKELIERQAMLQKAERSEIMQDPAIRRELENKQLGQWLDRSLQVERDAVRVTDDDLRAHYDAHPEAFTHPEMSRLAMLYRQVSLRDPEETKAALRAELEQGRAAFLADPAAATQNGQMPGFGAVAAQFSEDPGSRYRGGDLGWLEESSGEHRQPAAVIETGLALAPGAVSEVISAADGLYVVMKSDRRPARVAPFDEVAPALRRQLIRLKQEEVERRFMSNLMAEAKIEINPDKAARLALPPAVVPAPPELQSLKDLAPQREEFE